MHVDPLNRWKEFASHGRFVVLVPNRARVLVVSLPSLVVESIVVPVLVVLLVRCTSISYTGRAKMASRSLGVYCVTNCSTGVLSTTTF